MTIELNENKVFFNNGESVQEIHPFWFREIKIASVSEARRSTSAIAAREGDSVQVMGKQGATTTLRVQAATGSQY